SACQPPRLSAQPPAMDLIALLSDPETWVALVTLIVLEVVLGIDNLVFIAILSNKLPPAQQQRARRLGLSLALGMRIGLLLMIASDPLARFIEHNPTLVMLALAFLVMIGLVLIADGFGFHVPKGYIYAAMAFSGAVEGLNIWGRRRREKARAARESASDVS